MILERLGTRTKGFSVFAAPGVRAEIASLSEEVRGAILAQLKAVTETEKPTLSHMCRDIAPRLFELRPTGARLPFYYDPENKRTIIVAIYMKKQKLRMPNHEKKQAERVVARIEAARLRGDLAYEV